MHWLVTILSLCKNSSGKVNIGWFNFINYQISFCNFDSLVEQLIKH